jgi:hypothetical protein
MTDAICKIARAKTEIADSKRQIARDKSQMTCVILLFASPKSEMTRAK